MYITVNTLHEGVNTCNNNSIKEMVCCYACVVITQALVRIFCHVCHRISHRNSNIDEYSLIIF